MFCEKFEIIVAFKSLSAGTLIALGAEIIVMTKQAVFGPIDPSINHELGPIGEIHKRLVPVSVEAFNGYFDVAREFLAIDNKEILGKLFAEVSKQIHPLTIGEVSRSRTQIRNLAKKLLAAHLKDQSNIDPIIDFLCSESGRHDYTINRREAESLGLNIEKPEDDFYSQIRKIRNDFRQELEISVPFNPLIYKPNSNLALTRTIIESVDSGAHRFQTFGQIDENYEYKFYHEAWIHEEPQKNELKFIYHKLTRITLNGFNPLYWDFG